MSTATAAVHPLEREDIRFIVKKLRLVTAVDHLENFCVAHWLETKFLPMVGFELDVRDREYMGYNHGLTSHAQKKVFMREDIYERACDGYGRDRMTVVHEAGHCFMHTPDRVLHARSFKQTDIPRVQDPEWQAKAFAGEFLMPVHLIEKGMDANDMAEKFGVSLDAAEVQFDIYRKARLIK